MQAIFNANRAFKAKIIRQNVWYIGGTTNQIELAPRTRL